MLVLMRLSLTSMKILEINMPLMAMTLMILCIYGIYDDHHTYHEGEQKGTFWGSIAEEMAAAEPPTGFQGIISWLFPPAIALGVYFNVPGEYLYIGAGIFTIIFCIIEMDKPDKAHHFEPHIYNMEMGARDKLINDYNTMSIWEFNEKYGDLWDTTSKLYIYVQ
ncbi:hypothetical protein JHK82_054775 [Glycine max]|uniref:Photosynthetic NDH subunit of subcomplex B 5, chloroplastic n=2 Tax=Glycine subgen. Soja TaxID=1462606 RepID=I1NCU7_SOYBN|nr:hypothetical protein JHK86_054627 [Glycine max]KAG4929097.1 hypothetical protein JHK85_055583 [Glycine max]KAG5084606.1 hypothetical protein JHK84_054644 [Glycine max]KAG5087378.1 hypothetical protein JHK82_054775 [Glycine max]KAH1079706.1 hypothetical protein GYH30_054309 [Glycine max]